MYTPRILYELLIKKTNKPENYLKRYVNTSTTSASHNPYQVMRLAISNRFAKKSTPRGTTVRRIYYTVKLNFSSSA